jgi:tetratricopeptide (TPR) repeat protein/transglutaminase-like putative cysteine protease
MHSFSLRITLGSVLLCCSAAAQTPATTPVADDFRNEALVFERYEMTYRMHADGTGERANHVLIRIQSEGAARQFSVLSFAYASANETPHIELVRVHKADGSVVDTPVADAIEMSAAVTREAPLYSDLKEKHVPVRSLAAGDTLEYDVRITIDKAEAPSQFWGAHHFTVPGTIVVKTEVLTVEVPKDKYVQVWSPNHKAEVSEHDGLRSYRWTVAQLVAAPKAVPGEDNKAKVKAPKDPDQDADGKTLPSVAWTTFHTWAEVGEWYRGLALARAQPNDALRAKAEEITKNAKTPEEQVRAIYGFVSGGTRYVGIDFGVGRYQPHAAVEVLANQYGDCKDKDTLLEALLRAKGFKTAPALIGAGITPTPDVPSPATFNHVITTVSLPDGRIWLDSTPEVAPYRYLSANLRDQPALVVPAEGAATLEHAPEATPYPFVAKFESAGTLDKDGKLVSKITASYRTDDELIVRALARGMAPATWDKASQYISSNTGFSGTTSETHFNAISDLSKPIEVEYAYTRHPYGDWDNHRIIPPFPVLDLTLLGEDATEPDDDIELGTPRTLTAVAKIRLPEGYTTDLPDAVHVKTDFATFDKTYRFDGKEIVIERTVVIAKKKLPKADWKRYQAFTKQARLDSEPWIQLIEPTMKVESKAVPIPVTKNGTKSASPTGIDSKTVIIEVAPPDGIPRKANVPETTDVASAAELMQKAGTQMQNHDLDGAKETLDKVKAKNPNEPYLWVIYGALAEMRHNTDEAKLDFEKEASAHPDDPRVASALAELEERTGEDREARKRLQAFLERHPDNLSLSLTLARLQTSAEDNEGALKTLQAATDHRPEDRVLRLQLSQTLLLLDRKDEAAAAAKSVLDGSDDTLLQNNAAYVLADAGLDLADAEAASRKSIATLEEKSAAITTEEVNSSAFAQANLLISSWDTLGWVLFREGKLEEAKPLIMAAWRNGLRPEEGDHLGQLYEAMDKKDEAYTAYSLAQDSLERGGMTPEVKKHLADSVTRLKKGGAKTAGRSGREALQDSRTYKIPGSAGMSGWGTFRLQITAAGVVGSQQMSGEQKLAGMTKVLGAMKFPELVPPDSKAHLLRSGVVSCSSSTGCELVLVPNSGLQTERY